MESRVVRSSHLTILPVLRRMTFDNGVFGEVMRSHKSESKRATLDWPEGGKTLKFERPIEQAA
jgi:hypothetical protein